MIGGVVIGMLLARQEPIKTPEVNWVPNNKLIPLQEPIAKPRIPAKKPQATVVKTQEKINNYELLLQNAKEQNKQVVLFFTAKRCVYCQKMKDEVLPTNNVQQALKQTLFYVVDVDVEPTIGPKFNVSELPTMIIIDGNERIFKKHIGYMTSEMLINWVVQPTQPLLSVPQLNVLPQQQRPILRQGNS